MRVRSFVVAPLALFLLTTSSGASVCDLSCAFEQAHSARHAMNHSHAAFLITATNLAAHLHHRCCRDHKRSSAITAPHLAMSPHCADDACLRLPQSPDSRVVPASVGAIKLAAAPVASTSITEAPPFSVGASAGASPAAPRMCCVLRI